MVHTPTPWKIGLNYGSIIADPFKCPNDHRIDKGHIEAYGGLCVAESASRSDIAFIVKACNNYERLWKALDKIIVQHNFDNNTTLGPGLRHAAEIARKALEETQNG